MGDLIRTDIWGIIYLTVAVLAAVAAAFFALRWKARQGLSARDDVEPGEPDAVDVPEASAADDRLARIRQSALAASTAPPPPPPSPLLSPTAFHEPGADEPSRYEPVRQAIVFRQYYPPRHDPAVLSFFGGVPIAPRGLAWPSHAADGQVHALHFILQVDLAEIPESARLGVLPGSGVLYLFLDLDWGRSNAFRFLYADNPSGDWVPAHVPDNLTAAYGNQAHYAWQWPRGFDDGPARCPRLLPKWPFAPVAIEIPDEALDAWEQEVDEAGESFPFWWPDERTMAPVLLAAQGDDSLHDSEGARKIVPETWPQDWNAVQIAIGLILERIRREAGRADDEADDTAERIAGEALEWVELADARGRFDAVPSQARDAFRGWFDGLASPISFVRDPAVRLSMEASLAESVEAAARIPAEALAKLRSRHSLAVQADVRTIDPQTKESRIERRIHANTPDRMLAPASDVQGYSEEISATHLLLLELSSDEGIGHHFGEGVYQFWIAPDDLRDRRFDRVEMIVQAY